MTYSTEALKLIASAIFARYPIQRAWLLNPSDSDSSSYVEFLVDLQIGADITVCLDAAADIEDIIHKETVVRRIINNHMPTVERVLVYERSPAKAQALVGCDTQEGYMNKTLTLAHNYLKAANHIVAVDDTDLYAPACSDISFAIKLCLQFLLSRSGIQIAEPYSISALIETLASEGYQIGDWLIQHADAIDSWETGMLLSVDPALCLEGLRKGQELLEYCKSLDTE